MKRRLLWIFVVLVVAGGLTGGYFYTQGSGGKSPFRTVPVTRGPVTAAISATGTLNAVITVLVGSQVSGQVKELYADFNSQVKKGQVIARIDPDIFEAKVNQAKAQVEAARAAVLNQQAAVERARADLGNARAALAGARAQTAKGQVAVLDTQARPGTQEGPAPQGLHRPGRRGRGAGRPRLRRWPSTMRTRRRSRPRRRRCGRPRPSSRSPRPCSCRPRPRSARTRRACARRSSTSSTRSSARPVDGVVVSRTVDVGQTVAASLQAPTLFTIAQDLTKMQVDTNVDEADVSRVKVGLRAAFTVDSFPGQVFTGEIVQIRKAPQVVQNVVTYDVVVSAQNTEQQAPARHDRQRADRHRAEGRRAPRPERRAPLPAAGDRGRTPSGPRGRTAGPAPELARAAGEARPGRDAAEARACPAESSSSAPRASPSRSRSVSGITDGTNTEVLEGPLKDKQDVIVGTTGTAPRPAAPPGPRLM